MRHRLYRYCFALLCLMTTHGAVAHSFTPTVVFDVPGKFDRSFGQAAYTGAERFRNDLHVGYRAATLGAGQAPSKLLEQVAQRHPDMIVAVSFLFSQAVEQTARRYPKIKFTLIDAVASGPNVQSILFKEHEGSFLAGMAAALQSRSGTVGFIGGMESPLIRAFGCGFAQGVKYVNPHDRILQDMAGSDASAFNNPALGARLAQGQLQHGADVIYAAAGHTGIGALQAAEEAGKYAIGVDSNQNYIHPGSVLTSMIKRVDLAVYQSLQAGLRGTWQPGVKVLGLKENALGLAVDRFNRPLLTPAMETRLNQARRDIIDGKIVVTDFRSTHQCPVH